MEEGTFALRQLTILATMEQYSKACSRTTSLFETRSPESQQNGFCSNFNLDRKAIQELRGCPKTSPKGGDPHIKMLRELYICHDFARVISWLDLKFYANKGGAHFHLNGSVNRFVLF